MVCVSDVIDFVELAPPNVGCWDWIRRLGDFKNKSPAAYLADGGGKLLTLITFTRDWNL